jgi:hypothetical protein
MYANKSVKREGDTYPQKSTIQHSVLQKKKCNKLLSQAVRKYTFPSYFMNYSFNFLYVEKLCDALQLACKYLEFRIDPFISYSLITINSSSNLCFMLRRPLPYSNSFFHSTNDIASAIRRA